MSDKAERLQEAIGLISDEYIEEAHAESAVQASAPVETAPSAQQIPAAGGDSAPEKVISMPPQRKRRRAVGPIAIAACLAIALGVGALAVFNAPKPAADSVAEKTATEEKIDREESAAKMAESVEDGAVAAEATARGESYNLVPGVPNPGNIEGQALVLTAGEWNDNANWPFFMNLVNSNTIGFPVFGIDPTHRVKATVVDASGKPVRGEEVRLLDGAGAEIWRGVSDKDGNAYLFFNDGEAPASISAAGVTESLTVSGIDSDAQQGEVARQTVDDVTIAIGAAPAAAAGLQVMFIVDTTGSMSDEIAYLQKDFAAIAGDVGSDGVEYSVNFYRDEGDDYVTKCNGFTSNVDKVQSLLNDEYAEGGGDAPEAVADILAETITGNNGWRDDCNKVAFLIFDAPPHEGTNDVLDAAVRSAAERGIRLVPVVASNADRETELFGRALAIKTGSTYVFLTDDSGVGNSHLEPIVGDYSVELLHDVIVRIINDNR